MNRLMYKPSKKHIFRRVDDLPGIFAKKIIQSLYLFRVRQ